MIPTKDKNITVQSNVTGSKHEMGIHTGAMAHIMNILTDLYSDPELAIIREYSTNALDAHIEAGIKRPIEVTLPSALAPFLKIKDFGVGLDEDGIREIYSQYGASTKRGTNDQVGMLGLGCKSALTYTNQFVLVGIKDGIRTQVQVSRDDNGTGSMTVVSAGPTTDEPGVEVIIPAKRSNEIEAKAKKLFRFWAEGTVKVNGAEPKRIDGLPVGKSLMIVPTSELNGDAYSYGSGSQDVIVMGNVSYPASISSGMLPYQFKLVAFVDVGSVDFTPSREQLHMTSRTTQAITTIQQDLKRDLGAALNKEVEASTSKADALRTIVKYSGLTSSSRISPNWTYKGQAIPDWIGTKNVPTYANNYVAGGWTRVPLSKHKLAHHDMVSGIATTEAPTTLWFTGYTDATWTPTKRKKLDAWLMEEGFNREFTQFVFIDKMPKTDGWVDPATIYDYDTTVKAIKLAAKLPSVYGSYKKIPGSYDDTYMGSTLEGEVAADDISKALQADPNRKLFYHLGNRWEISDYVNVLSGEFKDCYIVPMPANRVDKFKRLFPKAERCSDGVKGIFKTWEKRLSRDVKDALSMNDAYGVREQHRNLDASKVDDPELKRAIKLSKIDIKKILADRRVFANVLGNVDSDGKHTDVISERYPLYNSRMAANNHPHVYLYINAVYADLVEKGKV